MIRESMTVTGSVDVKDEFVLPYGTRENRPSSPDSGSLYLQTSQTGSAIWVYSGVANRELGWEVLGEQNDYAPTFFYRQIINYAYTAGGYINSSPWKTVHKTVAATDQTTNVGDLLDYPSSYSSGACSKNILFMWSVNTDGTWKSATTVADTYTSAVNMVNETNYAHQSKFDMTYARDNLGTVWQETEFAWMFGGSVSNIEKFNLTNESMYVRSGWTSLTSTLGCAGMSDQDWGYVYGSESGIKVAYATDSVYTTTQWGPSGQQKGISSKIGRGYCGNEGTYNGGYNLRRWQLKNETNLGTVPKPHPNCGEENFTLGQDWQYMVGNYDGTGQNNTSWKFYYTTESGTVNPAGLAPTAHGGQSSGHCGWRN